jgi:hypothetical protein
VASAGTAVSLGVTYPTLLGTDYSDLDRSLGFQADGWMDAPYLGRSFQLHLSGVYEPFKVKNQNMISVNTAGLFAGVRYIGEHFGTSLSPFLAADIGAVYSWMGFSGVAAVPNSSVGFAHQITPGFDLPIWSDFGLVGQFPLKVIYFKDILLMWDASLSIRWKL